MTVKRFEAQVPTTLVRVEEHFVGVGGAQLYVRLAGRPGDPVVLLLHGWPDTGDGWAGVVPHLSDRYRVVVPDNRGFGRSSMPSGAEAYRMKVLVRDVQALLAWAGDGAAVVGHDFGGAMAWGLGAFVPEAVEKLVVLCSPHPRRFHEVGAGNLRQLSRSFYAWLLNCGEAGEKLLASRNFDLLLDFAYGDVLSEVERETLRASWSEPGRFTAMAEWYRANYRPDFLNPDIPVDLPDVEVPTRYIHGMDDGAFVSDLATGHGAFVDAEYDEVIIEDGGHWIPRTHSEEVARLIDEWISES